MSDIKLSPAMVTALQGAKTVGQNIVGLPVETKTQTVKGLESRGLTDGLELTPAGVEAARQLGNDTTTYNEPAPVQESPELTTDQEAALESLGLLLDTPQVVPNRADKRRTKFSLRGAVSRMNERKRARRAAKYGDTKFGQAA